MYNDVDQYISVPRHFINFYLIWKILKNLLLMPIGLINLSCSPLNWFIFTVYGSPKTVDIFTDSELAFMFILVCISSRNHTFNFKISLNIKVNFIYTSNFFRSMPMTQQDNYNCQICSIDIILIFMGKYSFALPNYWVLGNFELLILWVESLFAWHSWVLTFLA